MTPEELAELEALTKGLSEDDTGDEVPTIHGRTPSPPKTTLEGKVATERPAIVSPKEAKRVIAPKEGVVYKEGGLQSIERISWPFPQMEVGHWFAVEDSTKFQRARLAASAYAKRHGLQITCQTDSNGILVITRRK